MLRPDVDAVASSHTSISAFHAAPVPPVPGGDGRLVAARHLERHLLRLARTGALVDGRLAPGLERMRSRSLYRLLGYVRLGDYLTERLGMSLRRCQAILRLERALERLPRLRAALQAGEVSLSKAEVVAGVASADTEVAWLERSSRQTVADLREAAAAARAAGNDAAGVPGSDATGGASCVGAAAGDASGGGKAAGGPGGAAAESIEQDEAGRLVSFSAPARVLAIWHWTLDLVRRVAGQQEPAWRCAEYLAAEFLSGVPDLSGGADGPLAPPRSTDTRGGSAQAAGDSRSGLHVARWADSSAGPGAGRGPESPASVGARDASGLAAWDAASAAIREASASPDPADTRDSGEDETGVPEDDLDAWGLDERLRRLVRFRQSLAWRQGRLLATFASLRLHKQMGFDTFEGWVVERLPMSPRRARYLVSLDRRLRALPLLAECYRRGLVTWCQARLLVRVVLPATQACWIRYARQVTVRRLEDVIVASEVAAAESDVAAAESPARRGSPAHIGAPLLPPIEPSPDQVATSATDRDPRHTSAPFPAPAGAAAPAAMGAASFDRLTRRRISFWAPLDVAALWDSALRACRAAAGGHLEDWECFLVFVQALRDTWENLEDPHWRRRYRIFERDGWRCMAPGCTSRSGLNEHHVIFRSRQGDNDEGNLLTLCILCRYRHKAHYADLRIMPTSPLRCWPVVGNVIQHAA